MNKFFDWVTSNSMKLVSSLSVASCICFSRSSGPCFGMFCVAKFCEDF